MKVIKNTFSVMDGYHNSYIREDFVIIGKEYLCIKSYTPPYKEEIPIGYNDIFSEGMKYKLLFVNSLSATFLANGGIKYFLKTYIDGCLFKHFDFSVEYNNYISEIRKEKIDIILNDKFY